MNWKQVFIEKIWINFPIKISFIKSDVLSKKTCILISLLSFIAQYNTDFFIFCEYEKLILWMTLRTLSKSLGSVLISQLMNFICGSNQQCAIMKRFPRLYFTFRMWPFVFSSRDQGHLIESVQTIRLGRKVYPYVHMLISVNLIGFGYFGCKLFSENNKKFIIHHLKVEYPCRISQYPFFVQFLSICISNIQVVYICLRRSYFFRNM